MMRGARRLGIKGLSSIVAHFTYRGSSIVILALAARLLSQADFGLMNVGVTLASISLACVAFGFDPLLLRDLSSARTGGTTAGAVLSVKMVFAALIVALMLGAAQIGHVIELSVAVVSLFVLSGVSGALAETAETILIDQERWILRATNLTVPSVAAVGLGFLTLVVPPEQGLFVLALIYLARDLGRLVLGLVSTRGSFAMGRPRRLLATAKAALPFASIVVLSTLYFRIDVLIIQWVQGAADVATYSAGYTLLTGVGGAATALGPILLQSLSRSPGRYKQLHKYAALVGLALGGLTALAAPLVVPALFGDAYTDSVVVAQLLAATMPFSFANSVSLRAVYATHLEASVPVALALAMAFNILGNIVLLSLVGILGAIIMTIATEALLAWRFHTILRKAVKHAMAF